MKGFFHDAKESFLKDTSVEYLSIYKTSTVQTVERKSHNFAAVYTFTALSKLSTSR